MRDSIRVKLFLSIGLVAVCFLTIIYATHQFCFERYYLWEKRQTLTDIYQQLDGAYAGDVEAVSSILDNLEYSHGVRMVIADSQGNVKYSSMFDAPPNEQWEEEGKEKPQNDKGFAMVEPSPGHGNFTYNEQELQEKGYTFSVMADQQDKMRFVSLVGLLSGGDTLMVGLPMANLTETARSTKAFMLIATIVSLLVCLMPTYLISRQISRPLIEMNNIAKAMARLQFDRKYTGTSRDEVGQLGESLNQLSTYLENAFAELKEMNEQLGKEVEMRKKIDEFRKEFIINVSHELKTPIAVVQGYAEGLRVNINSSEEDRNYYCDIIIDEAARMNKLVMQLLSLSKLELGNIRPDCSEVDLAELGAQVVRRIENLTEVQLEWENLAGVVWGDYDMVDQVLTNYLTNALHHTKPGGRVRMWSELGEGCLRVHVWNEGQEIPQEEMPKIWEKFYKLDKAHTRSSGGTGIGLSIVKAIMEAHGGQYGVENHDGGVDFWFMLRTPPQSVKPV